MTAEYENADLVLAGDLNARTKDFLDYIIDDDVDYIFGENNRYPSDYFAYLDNQKICIIIMFLVHP